MGGVTLTLRCKWVCVCVCVCVANRECVRLIGRLYSLGTPDYVRLSEGCMVYGIRMSVRLSEGCMVYGIRIFCPVKWGLYSFLIYSLTSSSEMSTHHSSLTLWLITNSNHRMQWTLMNWFSLFFFFFSIVELPISNFLQKNTDFSIKPINSWMENYQKRKRVVIGWRNRA